MPVLRRGIHAHEVKRARLAAPVAAVAALWFAPVFAQTVTVPQSPVVIEKDITDLENELYRYGMAVQSVRRKAKDDRHVCRAIRLLVPTIRFKLVAMSEPEVVRQLSPEQVERLAVVASLAEKLARDEVCPG
jgi:hypothetical protein